MKRVILFMLACLLFSFASYSQDLNSLTLENLSKKAYDFSKAKIIDSAIHYHHRVANLFKVNKVWLRSAKHYSHLALAWDDKGNIDTANYFANYALNIIGNESNNESQKVSFEKISIYKTIAQIGLSKGKYNAAENYYLKALELIIWQDTISTLKKADLWNQLGSVYKLQGKFSKAIEYCNKSLKVRQQLLNNHDLEIGESLYTMGTLYVFMNQYDKALTYLKKSLEIKLKHFDEDDIRSVDNYIDIGVAQAFIGDYDNALQYQEKAMLMKQKAFGELNPKLVRSYSNIGLIHYLNQDVEKALEYIEKTVRINKEFNGEEHRETARGYNNLGVLYEAKKDYYKALNYYDKAVSVKIQLYGEEHPSLGGSYDNIGSIYSKVGNFDKALIYHNKALKIALAKGVTKNLNIASIYGNLAILYEREGDHDKSINYQLKSLEILRSLVGEKNQFTVSRYNTLGYLLYKTADFEKALSYFNLAISNNLQDSINSFENDNSINALSKNELLKSLFYKGQTLFKLTNNFDQTLSETIKTYNSAFLLLNNIRINLSHESAKLVLSENYKNHFGKALKAATKYYEKNPNLRREKPFEFLEKSKSANLHAHLNNVRIKNFSNITDSLSKKEKKIAIKRRYYETMIQKNKARRKGYDSLLVQSYQDKLFEYSRQYDNLMSTFKNGYPDYYQLKYQQKAASIDELQTQLDDKTTLLNYFVGDTTLFIAAVTKDSLIYKVVKTDSLFNELLIDYHLDIEFDFTKDELQASTKLYNYLIAPAEDLIKNKNRLVIIPDEKLYYVPFETLCQKGESLTQPDYLVKNYAINYHHSATLWLNSKEKESKNKVQNSFIGFAPVFDPEVNNGSILSNEWLADTTNTELATRSVSSDFSNFNALPYSEKEIKSILKLFKKSGKAEGYLHKEASEKNFKQEAHNYKYVHIASHSFTNDKYPALSGIAFSQPDTTIRKENKEDGILYAGESYNLNLSNADLVVLSSCKSGLGKLVKGEGFLSLSRGFIYSGAPNIVYSLWSVNDEPTKNLMVHFYKQLMNGKSYAEALREAKLKILSNSKTAQPKYWAAWVLLGE